jgi:hypothetical protein
MKIKETIFIINRCDYTVEEFFKQTLPGCEVEDGCVVKHEGLEYSIMPYQPVGIPVQRDLQFYVLEEWTVEKQKAQHNVEIIKGLLKHIKSTGQEWTSELDELFNPNKKPE